MEKGNGLLWWLKRAPDLTTGRGPACLQLRLQPGMAWKLVAEQSDGREPFFFPLVLGFFCLTCVFLCVAFFEVV